jgi:N-acyl homoserine lactone hydrolase
MVSARAEGEIMDLRTWGALTGLALVATGAGFVARDLLPERWVIPPETPQEEPLQTEGLPPIDVTFLRCGSTVVPEPVAVRGGSLKRVRIAHSAVLIRHPEGTFLFDTGMCGAIKAYLARQSFLFHQTLGKLALERSIGDHLRQLSLAPSGLAFVLLSHLHWDHVSGIPDLPGVRLRVNRVEYEAAQHDLLDARHGLVRTLMSDNPLDTFDLTGPAYEGFSASYDLCGDGALVLVPLPGHTPGQVGMFINRSNGPRLLLIGDAAHIAANYLRPATMHPMLWSAVTSDDAAARGTLLMLHRFGLRHPEVTLIAMHDAATQARYGASTQAATTT